MSRTRGAVAVVAVICLAMGIVVPPVSAAPAPRSSTKADWTLLIYDVADTDNIADEMISNLAAFAALPDMPNVNVVALVDLPEKSEPDYPHSTLPGVAPFTTAKLLVLDENRWNEVRDIGEVDMGRPTVLASFIDETADRFPASKYGLVLADHGGGAQGCCWDEGPPATSNLSVPTMRDGIITGMRAAGIERFELIDHDACLMANYEAASALAPLTEFLSASEELTMGNATLSTQAIQSLGQNVSGDEWGKINNEAYGAWADRYSEGRFTAASVIGGDQMARLDAAVQSFADAASAHMAEIAPEVGRARAAALEFATGWDPKFDYFDLVDLGDFLRHLQEVPDDVAVARDAVFEALDRTVISQVTRQATQQATGLNVYFPKNTTSATQSEYVGHHIAPPGWEEFVTSYLKHGDQATGDADKAAQFVSPDAKVLHQGADGILIAGQLGAGDSNNVTDSATRVLTTRGGGPVLAIHLPAYLDAGGVGQVEGVWDYHVTAIGNGRNILVPVSSFFQTQSGGLIGTFYASYTDARGQTLDVRFRLLLDSNRRVQSFTVSEAGPEGSAPVELRGGTLTPYDIVPSNNGFQLQPAPASVPVSPDFQISFARLPENTAFDMSVLVEDLAGGVDSAHVVRRVVGRG